jgi:hypothetical protein
VTSVIAWIGKMCKTWLTAATFPSRAWIIEAALDATLAGAVAWMAIAAILQWPLLVASIALRGSGSNPPFVPVEASLVSAIAASLVSGLLGLPATLLAMSGLIYLISRALSGHASFTHQTYLLAAAAAPLATLRALMVTYPSQAFIISAALDVWLAILAIRTVSAIHALTILRSAGTVIVTAVVFRVISFVLLLVLGVLWWWAASLLEVP